MPRKNTTHGVVSRILSSLDAGNNSTSVTVADKQKDHQRLYKAITKKGRYDVGVTKDPDRSILWFWKKK